jgi:hypothetical protein
MNTAARLRELELQYLLSMSAVRATKAIYLATVRDGGAPSTVVRQTKMLWQILLAQKRALAAHLAELEDTDSAG